MDLFTHVLVAYLLSFSIVGFQPAYLAAGAIAGGLPDGDIFLFPLWRRFPMLRHHGITHSIFGVTVIAGVGGLLVAPQIAPGNPWIYFGVMEAAGLGHMLMDGFTHFSVPPLMPFSDRPLQIDADRAVNFLTLIVSVVSFYLLLGVERDHVAFSVYLDTVYALIVFFVAYFVIRLSGRLWIYRTLRARGESAVTIPTGNPFSWILLTEVKSGGRMTTTYSRFALGRGVTLGPLTVSAPMEAGPEQGPVLSESEALERSYPIARRGSRVLEDTYHFGEARRGSDGGWSVTWFSLEFTAFGRSAATRVEFDRGGTPSVHRAWYRPRWGRPGA